MQMGSDLDLPYLEMEADAFAADPLPHFERARAEHPWLARWVLGYVVTDYKAMRDLFTREGEMGQLYDQIVEIMDAKGTRWGDFQQRHMLNQMGPAHKRYRDMLQASFTPRRMNALCPLMRETITGLLDEWTPRGEFDFEEFASYYPISVMCRMIGASPSVVPGLRTAMEAIGLSTSMDKRWLPAMQEGVERMERFVVDLVAERRADPHSGEEDLLDMLIAIHDRGELTELELTEMLIFLFVAGYDTSKNMTTLVMNLLIPRPEMYEKVALDYDYAKRVVDEALRYHSTTSTQRVLLNDMEYRGVVLEKGSIVWFPMSVAVHDERYVSDPDRFDPERKPETAHIAFGLGPHICLGQYLARALIHEGIHIIAQRLGNPRTTGPKGWRPFPGAWGIRGLPVSFEARAALEPAAEPVGA
jgi:cytochrome P450